nr:histidine phosphatase family protein [Pseudopedobacter sp.]
MKRILVVIAVLLLFCFHSKAQGVTKVWIVRHAEKITDDPKNTNPDLSETGFKRAEDLKNYLSNKKIDLIYSTPYKRTEQTTAPLAKQKEIKIENYNPSKQQDLISKIKALKGNHDILIVGHSNTVLQIVRDFGVDIIPKDLTDNDYDFIFEVTLKNGKVKLNVKHFGEKHHSTEL